MQPSPECTALIVLAYQEEEEDSLAAVLPAYVEHSTARGRVLRLMGDGEVCSDHLGLLAAGEERCAASRAIAEALLEHGAEWDVADFRAVSAEDSATQELSNALAKAGCRVAVSGGPNTWAIDLPETWEQFLAMQSKSHRKQLRRSERSFAAAEDAHWELVDNSTAYDEVWPVMVDLHQRRRQSLGEPGCFASPRYAAFHADISKRLLQSGKLRLSTTVLDGRPVAAEYHFGDGATTYAYQGGLEPAAESKGPGQLSLMVAIMHAITEGHTTFDLLRGDESYKPHWRAAPRATNNIEIVPPRSSAILRYRAWTSLRSTKRWLSGASSKAPADRPVHGTAATGGSPAC
ncbi:MAG: GNAT family N-acetyltransferase [Planctomycetota bacterium]